MTTGLLMTGRCFQDLNARRTLPYPETQVRATDPAPLFLRSILLFNLILSFTQW